MREEYVDLMGLVLGESVLGQCLFIVGSVWSSSSFSMSISSEESRGMWSGEGDLDRPSLDDDVRVRLRMLLLLLRLLRWCLVWCSELGLL